MLKGKIKNYYKEIPNSNVWLSLQIHTLWTRYLFVFFNYFVFVSTYICSQSMRFWCLYHLFLDPLSALQVTILVIFLWPSIFLSNTGNTVICKSEMIVFFKGSVSTPPFPNFKSKTAVNSFGNTISPSPTPRLIVIYLIVNLNLSLLLLFDRRYE